MRRKMKTVREKREGKLRKDAWAKWRQSYRSHLSGQHYTERLVLRFFQRWKTKLQEVDHLEAAGDQFLDDKERKAAERCWTYWKRAVQLRNAERSVVESVGLRIMGDAMDIWKKQA
jgi:protein SFI1